MPRPSKGIRLWLRPEERDASGRVRPATWVIRDGNKIIRTGCRSGDRASADLRLAVYIAERYQAPRRQRDLHEIEVPDVLNIYLRDVAAVRDNPKAYGKRAMRLLEFWGDKTLADVTGAMCQLYAAKRGNDGGARRDLQDLSAAIQHHHKCKYHTADIRVWLPPKGERRERWLRREEIGRLVRAAWYMREQQRREHHNPDAVPVPTAKRTGRHIARAILMAYYTGSRIGDVLRASWINGIGRSFVDLEDGVFHRKPLGKRATKTKKQPTVLLGNRILLHLRRWQRTGVCAAYVVEWEGQPVRSIKTGFKTARLAAGLDASVNRHTLRHSRMTHMLNAGIPLRDAALACGMSEQIARDVYGHHDPGHQKQAVNAR